MLRLPLTRWFSIATLLLLPIATAPCIAGEADVLKVDVEKLEQGYRFDVTIVHDDTGWGHFADKWEIISPDGSTVAKRTLYHPHVGGKPFTRSLTVSDFPNGLEEVIIRAHDSNHGYGGVTVTVRVPP